MNANAVKANTECEATGASFCFLTTVAASVQRCSYVLSFRRMVVFFCAAVSSEVLSQGPRSH